MSSAPTDFDQQSPLHQPHVPYGALAGTVSPSSCLGMNSVRYFGTKGDPTWRDVDNQGPEHDVNARVGLSGKLFSSHFRPGQKASGSQSI